MECGCGWPGVRVGGVWVCAILLRPTLLISPPSPSPPPPSFQDQSLDSSIQNRVIKYVQNYLLQFVVLIVYYSVV